MSSKSIKMRFQLYLIVLFVILVHFPLQAQVTTQRLKKESNWLSNVEVGLCFSTSYRKWKQHDPHYPEYFIYEGSSYSFSPEKKEIQNWSTTFTGIHQSKFLWVSTEIGYEYIEYNKRFFSRNHTGSTHWQLGATGQDKDVIDSILGHGNRMLFSIGVGTPLLKSDKKYNVIPRFKFSSSLKMKDQLDVNSIRKTTYWHSFEQPEYIITSDSTIYPSRFEFSKYSYDLSVGVLLKIGPFKHWSLSLDFAYVLRSNYIINFPVLSYTDKLLFRGAMMLSYRFD